jgi:carboxyl-terminal processing protease
MSDRIPGREPEKSRNGAFQPLIYAILLVIGVYIGANFGGSTVLVNRRSPESNPNKLVNILNKIDEMYVDSVEKSQLIDRAIDAMLEGLDPHSYYISAEEFAAIQEPLEGNFEGIGVEFMIQNDTLLVVTPIEGGPSEAAGIQAGDKIVRVDTVGIAGVGLTNERVMKLLKGEKGTKVELGIERRGEAKERVFDIVRDKIPIHSVVASVMVEPEIGYLRLTRFARTSYEEFMEGMEELVSAGAQRIILDLRGNGGGYLNVAIPMVEEFLDRDKLIVYTEGKASPRHEYRSRGKGRYSNLNVVVLINHGSASASEILAGALQDHDRSITVGRRSFGKGLVQDEIGLPDNSALRLTVARYYTPTGRSIQRPYGEGIDYENEYAERYENGEFYVVDSIRTTDTLRFTTPGGRIVYGGGGITPDIFVPFDTAGVTYYFSELSYTGTLRTYAVDYTDRNRSSLKRFANVDELIKGFTVTDEMLNELTRFGLADGVSVDQRGLRLSRKPISVRIMAYMARSLFDEEAYYRVLLEDDAMFNEALNAARDYSLYTIVNGALTKKASVSTGASTQVN